LSLCPPSVPWGRL